MLDVKLLRNDFGKWSRHSNRGKSLDLIADFPALDSKWREMLQESEQLKNRRNTVSQEVAKLKKSGGDAEALIVEMREVGDRIKVLDDEIRVVEVEIES